MENAVVPLLSNCRRGGLRDKVSIKDMNTLKKVLIFKNLLYVEVRLNRNRPCDNVLPFYLHYFKR